MNVPEILRQAGLKKKENKKFVLKLHTKKAMIKQIDDIVHEIHDEVFEKIDCLQCANCCKTTSPIFKMYDIERLSKHFRVKAHDFIEEFLRMDGDGDYVLREAPCPFLDTDNTCTVYDFRPNACREYPHTNRKKFYQLLDLSLTNTEICPAVFEIFERLKPILDKPSSKQ
jgi:Fe-S-cluster containining protein